MTTTRRGRLIVAFALLASTAVHAEDEPLPKGAIARLSLRDATHGPVIDVALSPDGRTVVSVGDDGSAVLWDVGTSTGTALPKRHVHGVSGVAFSPVDERFATCGSGDDVRLWSATTARTLPLSVGRTHGDAQGPAFSSDGRWLVAGAAWGAFVYWDTTTGERLLLGGIGREIDHSGADYRLAWSPDGAFVATGHADRRVVFVRVGGEAPAYDVDAATARGLSWSPDGSYVAVVAGGELSLRRPEGNFVLARMAPHFTAGAHSPTAHLVAAGDESGRVRLLRPPSLEWMAGDTAHQGEVRAIAFSGDGRRLATGGMDGVVIVWDVAAFAGTEPEPMQRAAPSGVVPSVGRPIAFPPADLRVAKVEGLEPAERVEPYAGTLPGVTVGDDQVKAVLVIDGTTGRALPGATLACYDFDIDIPPGRLLARSTTDAFGVAFVVWNPEGSDAHWVVDAPGFAPFHEAKWTELPRVVVLFPGKDLTGRLLDPYGRPLAGAQVDLFLGYGHAPPVRHATSGDDGLFTLPACPVENGALAAGRLEVRAPGCSSQAFDARPLGQLGASPATFVMRPGVDVRGRVIDGDGWPAVGIEVRAEGERHVTITSQDGSFELGGVAPGADIDFRGQIDIGTIVSRSARNWGRPNLPLLVDLDEDSVWNPRGTRVRFEAMVLTSDGRPAESPQATLTDARSGRQYAFFDSDEQPGRVYFDVPEGEYVLAPGTAFSAHAGVSVTVGVTADQSVPTTVRVAPQPSLDVRIEGEWSLSNVVVVADGAELEIDVVPEKPVHLPADGPAALVVRQGAMQRAFPVGPTIDGRRSVVFQWPKPKRIHLIGSDRHSLGQDGIEWNDPWGEEDPTWVETHASGLVRLEEGDDDPPVVAEVSIPDEPGASVEAHFHALPQGHVTLLRADGTPLVDTTCAYDDTGAPSGALTVVYETVTDAHGVVFELLLDPVGSIMEIRPTGHAPRRFVVAFAGDQSVMWGDATLVLDIADAAGRPLDAVLWLDGSLVPVANGHAEFRGMDAGRRTVLAAATGMQAQAIDVHLPKGGTRTIRVVLPELGR